MLRAFFVAVCIFSVLGTGSVEAAKRVGLVIGNGDYAVARDLANPGNDAKDVAAALERLGFEVIFRANLGARELRDTVREFKEKLRGAEVSLFFYAGHAVQVNGQNYLLSVDSKVRDESDLDFEALPLSFIQKQMEREAKTVLVFLDACRDNPYGANSFGGTRSASPTRGLARTSARSKGTFIAFATEPNNVALDGDGRNSPFTSALLENLERPGIEISTLMTDVRRSVYQATDGKQLPWTNSSLLEHFYFKEKGPEPPAPVAAPTPAPAPAEIQVAALTPSDHLSRARQLHKQKNFVQAADHFRQAAEGGQTPAMTFYGKLLSSGAGVREDKKAAHGWFVKAAKAGDAEAQFLLGRSFERGEGTGKKDLKLAVRWYQRAAKAENGDALNNLGVLYSLGEGVKQNNKRAIAHFKRGAKAGNANAMFNLAAAYDEGRGVRKSAKESARLVLSAIRAGNKGALLEMQNNSTAWSAEHRKEVQRLLKKEGRYAGGIDGAFGPATSAGLAALAPGN